VTTARVRSRRPGKGAISFGGTGSSGSSSSGGSSGSGSSGSGGSFSNGGTTGSWTCNTCNAASNYKLQATQDGVTRCGEC
jgi:hypothetical protein